jgi:limonene-1,2-epoxide hydrolase
MHLFRAAVEARDIDAAVALLSDDVVLHSPVGFTPYNGPAAVAPILRAVSQVFEDFHYVREIGGEASADSVLVFRARVGDLQIEGCDIIHVDAQGAINELTVMVRPLKAALVLAEKMSALVAGAAHGPRT